MLFFYVAYNLNICSQLPLPELTPASEVPDSAENRASYDIVVQLVPPQMLPFLDAVSSVEIGCSNDQTVPLPVSDFVSSDVLTPEVFRQARLALQNCIQKQSREESTVRETEVASSGTTLPTLSRRHQGLPDVFSVSRDIVFMHWHGVGRFILFQSCIFIAPDPNVADSTLRAFLLGPVLAVFLHRLGYLILHVSAVAVPDQQGKPGVVAFVGRSGEGKSTMAAALHAQGYRVVADDYLAVPFQALEHKPNKTSQVVVGTNDSARVATSGELQKVESEVELFPIVYPGYPALRLSSLTLQALGQETQALPLLHPEVFYEQGRTSTRPGSEAVRRVKPIESGFETAGLPLRCFYILERATDLNASVELRSLSPSDAMPRLMESIYFTEGADSPATAAQFLSCAALANRLPVRILSRPSDLTRLSECVQIVLQDQSGELTE